MSVEAATRSYNLSEIPLIALKHSSRSFLSQFLNATKVLPSPSNLPRDWRGLSQLTGVCCPHANAPDPTSQILSAWEKAENPSIQDLFDHLKEIDRWDIIDDSAHLIEKDVNDYLKSLEMKSSLQVREKQEDEDQNILTIDDIRCIETCGVPQHYDAFLLYDDSDREFALTMLNKLEHEFSLKLCLKERDLVGGIPFEHEAIMRLIRERCRRLIVIVSPLFLESSANKFFLTFAQALGIEQRQRKIIPCVYSKFKYPMQLNYYFVLDFTRSSTLWDFWERLHQSIKAAAVVGASQRALPGIESKSLAITDKADNQEPTQKKWEGQKITPEVSATSQTKAICDNPSVHVVTESSGPSLPSVTTTDSTLSSVDSEASESQPILNSRTSSTASLLSKVFSRPQIKPKWLFGKKKKNKLPVVAVQS